MHDLYAVMYKFKDLYTLNEIDHHKIFQVRMPNKTNDNNDNNNNGNNNGNNNNGNNNGNNNNGNNNSDDNHSDDNNNENKNNKKSEFQYNKNLLKRAIVTSIRMIIPIDYDGIYIHNTHIMHNIHTFIHNIQTYIHNTHSYITYIHNIHT